MPSSTSNDNHSVHRKRTRPLGLLAVAGAVALSLVVTMSPAHADDDLKDARDKVRKQMVTAKKAVASDESALNRARGALHTSQLALTTAQAQLATVENNLADAKAADVRLAAELQQAQAATDLAGQITGEADRAVEAQRDVIASAVQRAYQQQTPLVGVSILLGSDSTRDLANRLQWTTTIFDSTSADYAQLSTAEARLATAQQSRQTAEDQVSAKRAESAQNLARVKSLADQAAAKRAQVASLVASNTKLTNDAADELATSKAQYDKLEKQEAKLTDKINGSDDGDYSNPNGFIKPVNAPAGSPFGMRFHPILHYWRMHWGQDFGAACGTPIRAMANGKVIQEGWTTYGFGNFTLINYGKMFGAHLVSGYAHQSKIIVKAGQHVTQGEIVGYVGTTGLSTGCHLHLQIYRNGVRVNPMRYL